MSEKPTTSGEYSAEQNQRVRATCLYLATVLGDCMDHVVIIGGLVPSLLIDQDALPAGADRHVGSMDLDIGLTLAIFEGKRYEAIGNDCGGRDSPRMKAIRATQPANAGKSRRPEGR